MKFYAVSLAMLFSLAELNCHIAPDESLGIPMEVRNEFHSQFPSAHHVSWEMEENSYEATFSDQFTQTSVVFTTDGKLVQTEQRMAASSLPEGIQNSIEKNFPGKRIAEVNRISTATGNILFAVEIAGEEYIYNESGILMDSEVETHDDGD